MILSKYYENMKTHGFIENLDFFSPNCIIIFNNNEYIGAHKLLKKFLEYNIHKFDYHDCLCNYFIDINNTICNSSGKIKLLNNVNKPFSTEFFSETFVIDNYTNKITHYTLKFHK